MIKDLINKYRDDLISYRRHFHKNPEESWCEFETSAFIKAELDKHGITYKSIASTGVLATINGSKPGKIIGLRADIDGLKVSEEADHDYKSTRENLMHACGHDGHAAMLLSAAIILNQVKDKLRGSVKLLFQPAEETVEGAKTMIEEGAIEGVEEILGIHLWSGLETGKISVEAGPVMASGDLIKINIEGKGGHGSLPHQTLDASMVAASLLMNLQSLVSRNISPLESVVLSIGEIRSGSRFNVISGSAELVGTVRCFNPSIRSDLPMLIENQVKGICKAYGASYDFTYTEGTPPTINNENLSIFTKSIVKKAFSEGALVALEKTTGSEDMAYYLEKIPGVIAFVGSKNIEKECHYPHHHPKFNIDEDSLAMGLELYLQFCLMR